MGIPVDRLNKLGEGSPHVVDEIERGEVDLVINTPTGTAARADGYEIRRAAIARGVPCITTLAGGMAAARAIAAARHGAGWEVRSLQEIHRTGGDARGHGLSARAGVSRPTRVWEHRVNRGEYSASATPEHPPEAGAEQVGVGDRFPPWNTPPAASGRRGPERDDSWLARAPRRRPRALPCAVI